MRPPCLFGSSRRVRSRICISCWVRSMSRRQYDRGVPLPFARYARISSRIPFTICLSSRTSRVNGETASPLFERLFALAAEG